MKTSPLTLLFINLLLLPFFTEAQDIHEYFYVFSDKWENGIPTGFMGDKNGISMKIEEVSDNPHSGTKCVKITTDKSESWRGLHVQYSGAWNVSLQPTTKLPNLTGYEKLEFYARAETTGDDTYVIGEIGMGGGDSKEDKRSDTFLEIGHKWKKYTINLKGTDLSRINTLLYMVLPVGTLYLDEIRYVKKK
ncbi:MAG TPA: hypothetical protein VNW99_02145 [Cytophagaceae bacterium]|jgi:hypothetical protein|nr:hypothetical protein [Cytophagaceae bacterium]